VRSAKEQAVSVSSALQDYGLAGPLTFPIFDLASVNRGRTTAATAPALL
jgi:hypothetical protein